MLLKYIKKMYKVADEVGKILQSVGVGGESKATKDKIETISVKNTQPAFTDLCQVGIIILKMSERIEDF